ncbi:MAG: tyrosine-protein phosphatase [Treponema sp.]|nr:tyrosine-protein phosphatase [Treponema sp.]
MKQMRFSLPLAACALLLISGCATTGKKSSDASTSYKAFSGTVTTIEKYGHAVTDIAFADMQAAGYEHGDIVTVTFGNGYTFDAPIVANYDVDRGAFLVRTNYADGFIAACINYGKMNEVANATTGVTLTVAMKEKAGYLEQYEVRSLVRTDKRNDYNSDESFANFRQAALGSIGKNILYRASHPTRTDWTRAPFVSSLIEAARIKTVVNMSDSEKELASYLASSNKERSAYYASLAAQNSVVCLSMNMDFTNDDFAANIVQGVRFMISHEGPYLLHCNEGKDRTGFIFVLLESLAGAKKADMLADYMESYVNFYHVEKNSRKYNIIAKANFEPMYAFIANGTTPAKGARAYLIKHGMSDAEVDALIAKLKGASKN